MRSGLWGETLREYMRDYVHWATFGALCEFLPPDNRVTLADETDRHGLPVANFSYSLCTTTALVDAARVMEDMHDAAGAEEAITIQRYAHLVGGCRMAAEESRASSTPTCEPSPSRTSSWSTAGCARPRGAPTSTHDHGAGRPGCRRPQDSRIRGLNRKKDSR